MVTPDLDPRSRLRTPPRYCRGTGAARTRIGPPGALLSLFLSLAMAGCAANRPVLYPNDHLREIGDQEAQLEIDQCVNMAGDYVPEQSDTTKVAKKTATGAAVGAVIGTAVGATVGRAGRGAAAGAAGGGTSGLLRGLFRIGKPDPMTKRFVEQCLSERGYRVIGWE